MLFRSPIGNIRRIPIAGRFSLRRLRLFIARKGTELEKVQAAIEIEWRKREDMEDSTEPSGSGETIEQDDGDRVVDESRGFEGVEEA